MALVNTGDIQEPIELKSLSQLTRILQMALADEASAASFYDKVNESVKNSSLNEDIISSVGEELEEIFTDEINHQGRLLSLMKMLDERISHNMHKGEMREE